ncbi:tRNA pseudouridine(38/39) synthase, partial [Frankliniella fusca]
MLYRMGHFGHLLGGQEGCAALRPLRSMSMALSLSYGAARPIERPTQYLLETPFVHDLALLGLEQDEGTDVVLRPIPTNEAPLGKRHRHQIFFIKKCKVRLPPS